LPHPFRFGVQLATLPPNDWAERLRRIEAWGYDSVFWPDHFGPQWEPVAALAAAAAVTQRLKVGSLVYGIDYRHPIVLAKAAATIQLLSGGRHEFGIGAGWMEADYRQAGMRYDRAGLRIERLEEALAIIRGTWSQEKTSFAGRHYTVSDAQAAVLPRPAAPPRILIGGGGPKVLAVAGRHADIVGVNPKVAEGRITAAAMQDATAERTLEKVRWVKEAAAAAGRDVAALEWNALVFVAAVTDDPKPLREALAKNGGMTVEQVATCPLYLTGSAAEIREELARRREAFGISYVVIQGHDEKALASFAEHVVAPLAGK
jgi:probable F420-dependent oxidoreductase